MPNELDKAIEALECELQNITVRSTEIKKTINQLLFLNGAGPRYQDIEGESFGGKNEIESRQFVAKDMVEAVKEVLRLSGKKLPTAQEILDSLKKGDFGFPKEWKPKLYLRNLAIFLGSRRDEFVWFETNDSKVYGLTDQYPERKKELDRMAKARGNNQESAIDLTMDLGK